MKKALFIYNPVAGRKKLRSDVWSIISILGKTYQLNVWGTTKAGDGKQFVIDNKDDNYDIIICCGGDGTLNEVINGIIECGITIPLGYIPCGSTNDFAKSISIPTDPFVAAFNIANGKSVPIDVGLFNNSHYFSYIASFGVFTATSYSTPQKEKNSLGHLAYIFRGSKELYSLKNCPIYEAEVTDNKGEKMHGEYIFGAVCNSRSVGGLVKLPENEVDMSDGLFEALFIQKPKDNKEWMSLLKDISHKKILSNPLVHSCKTNAVNIKMPAVDWSIDGEKIVGKEETIIMNQKHAINIIV